MKDNMKKCILPYYHQPTPKVEEFSLGSNSPIIVSNVTSALVMSKVCLVKFMMQYAFCDNFIDLKTRMHKSVILYLNNL
jgi:hypothetical protein